MKMDGIAQPDRARAVFLDDRVHGGEGLAPPLIEKPCGGGHQVAERDAGEPVLRARFHEPSQCRSNIPPHHRIIVERLGEMVLLGRDFVRRVLEFHREGAGSEALQPQLMRQLGEKPAQGFFEKRQVVRVVVECRLMPEAFLLTVRDDRIVVPSRSRFTRRLS